MSKEAEEDLKVVIDALGELMLMNYGMAKLGVLSKNKAKKLLTNFIRMEDYDVCKTLRSIIKQKHPQYLETIDKLLILK